MNTFSANNLSVRFADRAILHDLAFEFGSGQWIGLLGPNGAGKTTLLRAMAGLIPYSGSILLEGQQVRDYRPRERAKRLAFVRQTHEMSFDFQVLELVLLGRSPHKSLLSVYEKADFELTEEALSLVDLEGFTHRHMSSLSGGEQQRVFLAQALAQGANILLLDEPTAHLDVHHQYEFLHRVREFVDNGMTVVGAFHDLELAARFSDRIVVLQNGKLASQGAPADVLNAELIAEIFQMQAFVAQSELGRMRIRFDHPLKMNR